MVVRCGLFSKFVGFVHHGVHGTGKLSLRVLEWCCELEATRVAHDHEVHVAFRELLTSGDGAVNESRDNAVRDAFQGLPEHVDETGCFEHQATKFREDWAGRISLVIDPVSVFSAAKDAGISQVLEFAS